MLHWMTRTACWRKGYNQSRPRTLRKNTSCHWVLIQAQNDSVWECTAPVSESHFEPRWKIVCCKLLISLYPKRSSYRVHLQPHGRMLFALCPSISPVFHLSLLAEFILNGCCSVLVIRHVQSLDPGCALTNRSAQWELHYRERVSISRSNTTAVITAPYGILFGMVN